MTIGTLLFNVAPQISAANWNAINLCCPRVVPLFPPTGERGLGSLKPLLGPSIFWIVIVTDPNAVDATHRQTKNERTINEDFFMDS
jgi:hypothetical protein